jgi:hypothetical protein
MLIVKSEGGLKDKPVPHLAFYFDLISVIAG